MRSHGGMAVVWQIPVRRESGFRRIGHFDNLIQFLSQALERETVLCVVPQTSYLHS